MGNRLAIVIFVVLCVFDVFVLATASVALALRLSDSRRRRRTEEQREQLARAIKRMRLSLEKYSAPTPSAPFGPPPVRRSHAEAPHDDIHSSEERLTAAGTTLTNIARYLPDLDPLLAPLNDSLNELFRALPPTEN